jgi:hypothetical protein
VRAVVEAARRLSSDQDPLGCEARRVLPDATGLSPEGVDFALRACLETRAGDDEISALIASVPAAPRVHVVLSANVFAAAARALALAVASAPEVVVRPSRREPFTIALLCRALAERPFPLRVGIADSVSVQPGEHVHAYGRRESLEAIARQLPSGASFWGHGPGVGVAIVTGRDDPASAAERLSWDVIAFDQRGCLSPRIVLCSAGASAARDLAHLLSEALDARQQQVPRGRLDEQERYDLAMYARTVQTVGTCVVRPTHVVGVDAEPGGVLLPPPGRNVHIACVTESPAPWFGSLVPSITVLGHLGESDVLERLSAQAPWARLCQLGEMQRPPLDGPVDRRARIEQLR